MTLLKAEMQTGIQPKEHVLTGTQLTNRLSDTKIAWRESIVI